MSTTKNPFSHFSLPKPAGVAAKLFMLATAIAATSCSDLVYDDLDPCDFHVRFRYDYHLKKGDAFPYEANAVTLYVIDPETDKIVMQKTDDSEAVRQEGYTMKLEGLEPGNYKLLAWAGDGHKNPDHFTMGAGTADEHLSAYINRDAGNVVETKLDNLYKDLDEEYRTRVFPANRSETHTVRMMKNTNDIHIVLQQLAGSQLNPKDFTFEIEEANGSMDHHNRLNDPTVLTYKPWRVKPGVAAGFVPEGSPEETRTAVIADFTVGRMMADRKMYLTIRRAEDGGLVTRVPVIDYALMVKGRYDEMPDQEYLDRQDDYSMVFFLDDGLRWSDMYIYVNSWLVVPPQEEDL